MKDQASFAERSFWNSYARRRWKNIEAGTVYKIDTINVDGKPEVSFKSLK